LVQKDAWRSPPCRRRPAAGGEIFIEPGGGVEPAVRELGSPRGLSQRRADAAAIVPVLVRSMTGPVESGARRDVLRDRTSHRTHSEVGERHRGETEHGSKEETPGHAPLSSRDLDAVKPVAIDRWPRAAIG